MFSALAISMSVIRRGFLEPLMARVMVDLVSPFS